ncbi:MAG: cytochrome c biogenesis protein CcsA [Akkermansia sp.]|nr:cytochrome c biogenesis protein CcsA [Akkermansia sp.]
MTIFITLLTIFVLLLCAACCTAFIMGRTALGRMLEVAAWGTALALFVANWCLAQALPFGNMRHVLCFFPLVLAPASLYMRRCRGVELTIGFAAVGALAMVGALCMPMQAAWRQMPALQSPWFAPHVTSYVVAYGLLAVSFGSALLSFRRRVAALHLQAADAAVRLAFPFLTFGLWSGALWADAAWARYWAWDIKEVWALITWCVYLLYFHLGCKATVCVRRILLLLGFVAVLVTFFVVNLLPNIVSVHSYAQ